MHSFSLLTLFLVLIQVSVLCTQSAAADCKQKLGDGVPNMYPIYTAPPVFVRSVPNGMLFIAGDQDDAVPIVHVWGTPYQRGFAHGTLMKAEAQRLLHDAWAYFEEQVIAAINGTAHSLHIPQPIIDEIAAIGLEAALDITYQLTKDSTGAYFYEEMRGLADACEVDFDMIRRVHMIGELTKGSCSMYGAWGAATATLDGRLLQLRALDWSVDGPFKNTPQVTVYHSSDSEEGHTFANIGWSGWIGSITGLSQSQLAISEIGVAYPDSSFGLESRIGIPFTNILRDIIQFDRTAEDALQRITDANRTCNLILGVGDGKSATFRGIQYSYSVANFYNDTDMMPEATWHPRIKNIVYYGMDWICPGFNALLAKQLQAFYGNITAQNSIRYITSIVQTGDLHVAVYDLSTLELYVANARGANEAGPDNAYDRGFIYLDMKPIFAQTPPDGTEAAPVPAFAAHSSST